MCDRTPQESGVWVGKGRALGLGLETRLESQQRVIPYDLREHVLLHQGLLEDLGSSMYTPKWPPPSASHARAPAGNTA